MPKQRAIRIAAARRTAARRAAATAPAALTRVQKTQITLEACVTLLVTLNDAGVVKIKETQDIADLAGAVAAVLPFALRFAR